ncbi:MAG: DNA repair ATPase, partial [Planctomycetaceae bacterium]
MSQADSDNTQDALESENQLEAGTYEIIRNRLNTHARTLTERLQQLNERRKDVFGSIDTKLLSTERITTAHNCVPRDMISIGNRFIFGYNVRFGLKSEMNLSDVFSMYAFREESLHEQDLSLIDDERFAKDFSDVYRYYKNAVFARFLLDGPTLHMVFRVGDSEQDIKSFKWVVDGDSLIYIDNRSEHEVKFPNQHEFACIRTHRDFHQQGLHPHISIEDRVFVETVGGDLTIKIENNTDSGEGIYSEPVTDKDQTLDDAEVYYASIGNLIAIKIRPYQEPDYRYFIYNDKIQKAIRMDSLQDACVLLPDDHGLIFSSGFYLQTGEYKTFDTQLQDMLFERRIPAANGEDHLHVFYNRRSGVYVLLNYNLISQQVDTPMICNGFSLFPAGELLCFKTQDEPQKHHAVQLWQTPFVDEDHTPDAQSDS